MLLCSLAWFQMGSYFGSSLCAVDLNADGLSDLLVGAPMFSEVRDEGQVSVYLNSGNVSSPGLYKAALQYYKQCIDGLAAAFDL